MKKIQYGRYGRGWKEGRERETKEFWGSGGQQWEEVVECRGVLFWTTLVDRLQLAKDWHTY